MSEPNYGRVIGRIPIQPTRSESVLALRIFGGIASAPIQDLKGYYDLLWRLVVIDWRLDLPLRLPFVIRDLIELIEQSSIFLAQDRESQGAVGGVWKEMKYLVNREDWTTAAARIMQVPHSHFFENQTVRHLYRLIQLCQIGTINLTLDLAEAPSSKK